MVKKLSIAAAVLFGTFVMVSVLSPSKAENVSVFSSSHSNVDSYQGKALKHTKFEANTPAEHSCCNGGSYTANTK